MAGFRQAWLSDDLRDALLPIAQNGRRGIYGWNACIYFMDESAKLTENLNSQADLTVKVKLKVVQSLYYSKAVEH